MTSNQACSGSPNAVSTFALRSLILALAVAVALPEELPAAPFVSAAGMQPTFALSDSLATEMLRVHCCHAHPLPPSSEYCCHSGAVAVGGYYGAAGVRGTARRTSRRTSRRVSRRR
jgi:hypothetical protein